MVFARTTLLLVGLSLLSAAGLDTHSTASVRSTSTSLGGAGAAAPAAVPAAKDGVKDASQRLQDAEKEEAEAEKRLNDAKMQQRKIDEKLKATNAALQRESQESARIAASSHKFFNGATTAPKPTTKSFDKAAGGAGTAAAFGATEAVRSKLGAGGSARADPAVVPAGLKVAASAGGSLANGAGAGAGATVGDGESAGKKGLKETPPSGGGFLKVVLGLLFIGAVVAGGVFFYKKQSGEEQPSIQYTPVSTTGDEAAAAGTTGDESDGLDKSTTI